MTFAAKLLRWYKANARDLPWRRTDDPYRIWISEVMLQQTTVAAVIPYYEDWIKKFPSAAAVAGAGEQEVLKAWQGLGYYQRAKNIHKAARRIVDEFDGRLPRDPAELIDLPGFGPYTSASVASIAFDVRAPVIDANVRRVAMRLLGLEGAADTSKDPGIRKFLETVMPRTRAGDFNQAFMELGALVCRSRNPRCNLCPLEKECLAFKRGKQEIIPQPKRTAITKIDVAVAVISVGRKIYIQQRQEKGLLDGLWEFPGGKIERGEAPVEALKREVLEEVGVTIKRLKPLITVKHYYTKYEVNLRAYACLAGEKPKLDKVRRLILPHEFAGYPMPSGTVKIVNFLLQNKS